MKFKNFSTVYPQERHIFSTLCITPVDKLFMMCITYGRIGTYLCHLYEGNH